jgi:dTDP-4-amino-4,6-dideoxygalactose transaminase
MSNFIQKKYINYTVFSKYLEPAQSTNQFSNYGSAVQLLEQRARTMLKIDESKAVIATSSGASAYQAILLGMFRKHDRKLRVFSQDFTFACNFQGHSLASPVDLDNNQQMAFRDTANEQDAILVVTNCFGHLQNIDSILEHAKTYNQLVIFDNAASPYSLYKGINSCNFGTASYISLHHTKPIGFGEGGLAIVDKCYETEVRAACNFGIHADKASHFGNNYKMSELSAAAILQWWDQFDIDELAYSYRDNYFKKIYKYINTHISLFTNYSDHDKFFPNCLPLVHDKYTLISEYPNEDAKKYYKPFFDLPNSKKLYENIVCLPITG